MRMSHPGTDVWVVAAYIIGAVVVLAIMMVIAGVGPW